MISDFVKMNGAGNDFIVIDNRAGLIKDGSKTARRLCDRHFGIGADGLLLLEASNRANYRMQYYNADGSYGGMCGNGGRCIAYFATRIGAAGESHTFEALKHIYHAQVSNEFVDLKMKNPRKLRLDISVTMNGKRIKGTFVDTGAPHVVFPVTALGKGKKLEELDVFKLGRHIRNLAVFKPNGTNVNFIQQVDSSTIKIRTYERGVEAETLACGTGAIAGAIAACEHWGLKPPIQVIPASGKMLKVVFGISRRRYQEIVLSGPVELVFRGQIELAD
ncbi:MAG TPA: diaminopimelate epimerase [Bacteroidota bacterium]|nr:diaminopimelate epimerase [Bacteroidota bacterium]